MQKISLQKPQTNFHVQEAIKTLRSNIDFSGEDIKAVCVTSALPGDGKSTISYELACSFAQSGRRVLLVDADMRKSVMRKFVAEGDAQYGLSHLLAGKAGFDDVMCQTSLKNLFLIFAGQFPPNPSELLGSRRFQTLVTTAREKLDMVIVDTPPVGSVIDAAVASRVCDGVVLVLRDGAVSYHLAQRVKSQLDTAGVRILGCVLNEVDISANRYYGHYYGKYYGKYYGRYYGEQ